MLSPTKPPIGSTSATIIATAIPWASAAGEDKVGRSTALRMRLRRSRLTRSPTQDDDEVVGLVFYQVVAGSALQCVDGLLRSIEAETFRDPATGGPGRRVGCSRRSILSIARGDVESWPARSMRHRGKIFLTGRGVSRACLPGSRFLA